MKIIRWGIVGPGNIARKFAITVLKQMDEIRRQIGLRYGADDE